MELTLFRIAQEALNNVRRHANATEVVTVVELTDSAVRMSIRDNGIGFKAPTLTEHPATASKLGLIGMHERARLLGGLLLLDTAPGRGTTVTVDVPL
jgi:signal transduction histidine kinase